MIWDQTQSLSWNNVLITLCLSQDIDERIQNLTSRKSNKIFRTTWLIFFFEIQKLSDKNEIYRWGWIENIPNWPALSKDVSAPVVEYSNSLFRVHFKCTVDHSRCIIHPHLTRFAQPHLYLTWISPPLRLKTQSLKNPTSFWEIS